MGKDSGRRRRGDDVTTPSGQLPPPMTAVLEPGISWQPFDVTNVVVVFVVDGAEFEVPVQQTSLMMMMMMTMRDPGSRSIPSCILNRIQRLLHTELAQPIVAIFWIVEILQMSGPDLQRSCCCSC